MAQHARGQILLAAVGVDQRAVRIFRHGVDGQVAADQVFFQRHARVGMKGKAAVAHAAFALGACQRVFGAGFGVQKHREVSADGAKALRLHLLWRGADHDIVDVFDGSAE